MRRTTLTVAGGVGAAFFGALCCIGPILFVTVGVGAGLASTFEPLRPLFGVVMLVLFALAAYTVYGKPRSTKAIACAPGDACAVPVKRTRDQITFWIALIIAIVLWTFPTWSVWLA